MAETKTLNDFLNECPPATGENYLPRYYDLLDSFYDRRGGRKSLLLLANNYGDRGLRAVRPFVEANPTLAGARAAMLESTRMAEALEKWQMYRDGMTEEEMAEVSHRRARAVLGVIGRGQGT